MSGLGQSETFVIVASTDAHGAKVVQKRIHEQLERSQTLAASCVFEVSSIGVELPAQDSQEPVEKLVEKVADSITKMSMTTLRKRKPAAN